ncbi:MAG: hypothetical protein KGL40_00755 [Rhodocyclaceae bacterium]|nr:hypothetical protein [Rhodocyclaceae bacterium]
MFAQIKSMMEAKGETLKGDNPELRDLYAQLLNERMSLVNSTWCDLEEQEERGQPGAYTALADEIAKLMCVVAAFGYSFGLPMEDAMRNALASKDVLKTTLWADRERKPTDS